MARSENELTFMSLNCEGFHRNEPYIEDILRNKQPDILCLQETWLRDGSVSLQKLCAEHSYLCIAKSGVDCSKYITSGRTPGGVAIVYKQSSSHLIREISIDSRRACAATVKVNSILYLVVNVYLPVDLQSNISIDPMYECVLNEVEALMHSHVLDEVIICGDFNTDFARTNLQSTTMSEFIQRNDLRIGWLSPNAKKQDTYINLSLNHSSCIDHFVLSERVFLTIDDLGVLCDPLNASGHYVVELKLRNQMSEAYATSTHRLTTQSTANWAKAQKAHRERYAAELSNRLLNVEYDHDLLSCLNRHCSLPSHRIAIDKLCDSIVECCVNAEHLCIPQRGSSGAKVIPGWSNHVMQQRETALFWHNLWVQSGRVTSGATYDVMKHTRRQYHYAIRHCRKNEQMIRKTKIAQGLETDQRKFWNEIKKVHMTKNQAPSVMDGVASSEEIANLFGRKYETLYQSVPTSATEIDELFSVVDRSLREESSDDALSFSADDVALAIKRLKPGKGDGDSLFFSDHLINGGSTLNVFLSILFNCMLVHGYAPPVLLSSVLISIPKNVNASLNDSGNYRSIALCSSITKLIDVIIINKCSTQLQTCDLQFGFKRGLSTVMCTSVFKEVVSYYTNRNSEVYTVLLDASKAFDRVHFGKLFNILIERKMPACIIRLLLDLYLRQSSCSRWNGVSTQSFTFLNGVKQGGVLSPILFTVYMDELLIRLKTFGIGCYVNNCYAGALCYADDISLLCPSLIGLNAMVKQCVDFAKEFNVIFNHKKTVALHFGKLSEISGSVCLNGNMIAWNCSAKHLGNFISCDMSDDIDCKYKNSCFIGSVNKLIGNFGHMYSHVKCKLFSSYCTSFYGSQMWRLSCKGLAKLCTSWQVAIRRLFCLPRTAHRWTLGPLHNALHIRTQLELRTLSFLFKMAYCSNSLVNAVFKNALYDARSDLGFNIAFFRTHFGILSFTDLSVCRGKVIVKAALTIEQEASVSVAKELLLCRDHLLDTDFDTDEIDVLIKIALCDVFV